MKKKYYPAVEQNMELPKMEELVLKFWNENNIFEQSVKIREKNRKDYVFYDGPPFATGLPHQGHLVQNYAKDTFARYHTMLGKKVERLFGWDCHGLPAEMGVEKEAKISGRKAIEEYGIDRFNELCRNYVLKYVNEWKYYVNRSGRWVDFDNGYKTMDLKYMESTLWVFKQLYDKGLIYEDYRVMPYSWTCQTPLSNFETRQDNSYREKTDKAVTIKFKLKDSFKGKDNIRVLAWTTTPWTLPSNLALAVNKDIDYIMIAVDSATISGTEIGISDANNEKNTHYILCKDALQKYKKEIQGEIVGEFKGQELIGLKYEPLFNYLVELPEVKNSPCFQILHGDFVSTTDGVGIVHIAPGFGEDDNAICKIAGIPTICPVDDAGKFIAPVNDYLGIQVFETNDPIIISLKKQDSWIKTEQIIHNYPHCWRTDAPLIYRAMPSYYVNVEKFKNNLIKNNQSINWIPNHIKDGRFGKWLDGARDWSITRNRFWGCPVPIWKSNDPKYPRVDVYGSIADLEKDFNTKITDLHRPYIDELTRPNPDDPTGKSKMVRVTDVLDCWFESGSMPYAQHHYPFENKNWFDKNFPADFIVEGDGQLRGWFYVLHVLGTALFDKPVFKNCISHGIVVDETGKKLSKRLGNYTNISDIFNMYGSDALRWFMLRSPVLKGEEVRMDKNAKDIKDTLRMSIRPVLNAYNFFCMYANSDGLKGNNLLENGIYYIKKGCGKNLLKDFLEIEKEAPNYKNNTDSFSENKTYYVVYKNNKAVAATTIKQSDKDILQIQKITVLEEYKKNDIKTDLLKFVLQDNFINRKKIRIQTQFHLKEQYNDFCFEETGEKYLKGEVEFIDMEADVEILQKQNYERKNNLISNVMDIYILSKLKIAIENIKKSMDNYAPAAACRESEEFFETLNNWYIRRNKGRFWKSEIDDDKQDAYNTLYTILITMSKTIAPVLPFTSEYVYRGLNNN